MKDFKAKLKAAETFDDARPILEAAGFGPASIDYMRVAYSVRPKQQFVFQRAQEAIMDEHEKMHHDDDEKETKEIDGGESHGPTTTGELPQVADIAPHADSEGMNSVTDTKDQMGSAINEAGPNGMMPGQPAPGQCPQGQLPMQQNHMMGYPAGSPGAMVNPQQQQMQYTLNQFAGQLKSLQEAVQTINKKVQEIRAGPAPSQLDLGTDVRGSFSGIKVTTPKPLKDTTDKSVGLNEVKFGKRAKLDNQRREISSYNDYLYDTKGSTPGVQ